MFIKNAWYVACRPEDLQEKPLGRTICGEKIVFYRGKENKAAAVEDFCPHRGAPLPRNGYRDPSLRDVSRSGAPGRDR